MDRREFVKAGTMSLLAASCAPASMGQLSRSKQPKLGELDKPLAINMWDFAWMMRHYKGGGMEDWDKALDELVERGYNALRVDCFPQFIAADSKGENQDTFYCPKRNWRPALWDNQFSITIEPKRYLVEFLTKCHEREIYLGLSSWFLDFATGRVKEFKTVDDVVRAWDETLTFIEEQGLLKNVIYVDLLNEYPLWNGYSYRFLNKQLDKLKQEGDIENVSGGNYDFLNEKGRRFNQSQVAHYSQVINEMITQKIKQYWKENRKEMEHWMEDQIVLRKNRAKELGVPYGNTEGWGTVMWMDHPDLDWDFTRETGLVCAELGHKHGYSFNCTSNFNHPHFGLWDDVAWHKEVTSIIKNG